MKGRVLHTKIASISSLETGALLGWREALPPTVAGALELEKKVRSPSPVFVAAWGCNPEPAKIWFGFTFLINTHYALHYNVLISKQSLEQFDFVYRFNKKKSIFC